MEILYLFIGVVSGIAATIFLHDRLILVFQQRNTWKRITKGAKVIIENILKDDGYTPEIIIAGGRAGAILGGILSGNLQAKKIPLLCIDFSYEWHENRRKIIIHGGDLPIENKKVLLVVGEVHTGETLRELINTVNMYKPLEIKTASLFESGAEHLKPDYCSFKITGKQKMPWHLYEKYEKKSFFSLRQ